MPFTHGGAGSVSYSAQTDLREQNSITPQLAVDFFMLKCYNRNESVIHQFMEVQ